MSNKSPVPEWFDRGGAPAGPGPSGPRSSPGAQVAAVVLALVAGTSFFYAVHAEFRVKALEGELASLRQKNEQAELERASAERARLEALKNVAPPIVAPPVAVPSAVPEPPEADSTEAPASDAGSGSLDVRAISSVMNRLKPAMKRCYEVALADDPQASGRISLALTISPAGTVDKVTATPTGKLPPSVSACVSRVARSARFPAATTPTTVNYPLLFAQD